jgi:hypothetical protein
MATVSRVSIDKVGKHFATVVRDLGVVKEAWVSGGPDAFDLWLLVKPIDMATELELCAVVDPLNERFPSTPFMLHILNPENFVDLRPEMIVPSRAQRVDLRSPR